MIKEAINPNVKKIKFSNQALLMRKGNFQKAKAGHKTFNKVLILILVFCFGPLSTIIPVISGQMLNGLVFFLANHTTLGRLAIAFLLNGYIGSLIIPIVSKIPLKSCFFLFLV